MACAGSVMNILRQHNLVFAGDSCRSGSLCEPNGKCVWSRSSNLSSALATIFLGE